MSEANGADDGNVQVLACSPQELHDYVTGQLIANPAACGVTVDQVVGDLKLPPNVLTLRVPAWDPADLPTPPRVALDDLDLRLVRQLAACGHASSGAQARRLGVSDATVRRRTQRLEANGFLRIMAAMDPVATGGLSALAFAICRHGSSTAALPAAGSRWRKPLPEAHGLSEVRGSRLESSERHVTGADLLRIQHGSWRPRHAQFRPDHPQRHRRRRHRAAPPARRHRGGRRPHRAGRRPAARERGAGDRRHRPGGRPRTSSTPTPTTTRRRSGTRTARRPAATA